MWSIIYNFLISNLAFIVIAAVLYLVTEITKLTPIWEIIGKWTSGILLILAIAASITVHITFKELSFINVMTGVTQGIFIAALDVFGYEFFSNCIKGIQEKIASIKKTQSDLAKDAVEVAKDIVV
jgi:hypothetical protein